MLGLRSAALVSFVTLLFSIGGSVGVLDKVSATSKSVALKKSKQRHRDDLHATLSSRFTTPVVKDPMPDSSGEGPNATC